MKTLIFLGTAIFGWLGWALAQRFTDDIMIAFAVSSVGSFIGIFAGYKLAKVLDIQ